MNDQDAKRYVVTQRVYRWMIEAGNDGRFGWDFIKQKLDWRMAREFFVPLLGNGLINVMSSEYKQWYDAGLEENVFSLIVTYSIAQEQKIRIMSYEPESVVIPKDAVPICKWCGQERHSDSRGGCAACGGTK